MSDDRIEAECPECSTQYEMPQKALDRLGCMYCPWKGAGDE